MKKAHLVAGLTLLALGCSEQTPPSAGNDAAVPTQSVVQATIEWHNGSVDSALALARAADKPVLLYWGAEWCPPCHQLKVTIFKERAFIDRSRLFVPIYLDGDTASAQKYAERFGVVGYPTMVVLSADGEEITRIAGGIDIDAYDHVLDAALAKGGSVAALVAAVVTGETISAGECRLLAYYSWGQDNEGLLETHAGDQLFPRLEAACPELLAIERARLFVQYLRSFSAEDSQLMASSDRSDTLVRVNGLLGDEGLARADLEFTIFEGADVAKLTTVAGSEARQQLVRRWQQRLTQLGSDVALPKRERIYTLRGKLRLQRLGAPDDAPPSPELAREIRRMAAWADTDTSDPYERQTVMNAVSNTLWEAGFYADARQVLSKERSISKYPSYFTLTLAELEQDAGNDAEALKWFGQAYEEAEGQATRFQWGFNYLVALMDVVPEDETRIREESLRVFAELDANAADAFYQRTRQRLESLEKRFVEWNDDGQRAQTLRAIRDGVSRICTTIPEGQSSRPTCEAFLSDV